MSSKIVLALKAEISRQVKLETARAVAELKAEMRTLRSELAKAGSGGREEGAKSRARGSARSAVISPRTIRSLRKRLGITQKELAELTGVTPVAVYLWESGRTSPSDRNATALQGLTRASRRAVERRLKAN